MAALKMDEWSLTAPWGQMAMVSWGHPSHPPVLLVHGYVDSAATFIPLVNLLPDHYYYVGFDLPGHGRSDSFPGPMITAMHLVECIRLIVEHLEWDTFICIAHSMGYLISGYYNAVFPGRMCKLVAVDPQEVIDVHSLVYQRKEWFEKHIDRYYSSYHRHTDRLYTYEEALAVTMRARSMTREQAALILSRSLAPAADGKYSLTWDFKSKRIRSMSFTAEMLHRILSSKVPTLMFIAKDANQPPFDYARKIFTKLQADMDDFIIINVTGHHNLHFTNPESIVENIVDFLNKGFSIKSKL